MIMIPKPVPNHSDIKLEKNLQKGQVIVGLKMGILEENLLFAEYFHTKIPKFKFMESHSTDVALSRFGQIRTKRSFTIQ